MLIIQRNQAVCKRIRNKAIITLSPTTQRSVSKLSNILLQINTHKIDPKEVSNRLYNTHQQMKLKKSLSCPIRIQ